VYVRSMVHRWRLLLPVLLAGVLGAGAAGCGDSSSAQPGATSRSYSTDPYVASSRYAVCMRQHGVPHPSPDRRGDFHLTPAQERRLRSVPRSTRELADKACFHHLKGLNMSPLSSAAKQRALGVLRQLSACMKGLGYAMGPPLVKNLPRGRAMFGFRNAPEGAPSPRLSRAQHTCEKRVDLAGRLDRIIADDRSGL
jgi:hypothetical protein